ncbi:hypothetical protein FACS1894185_1840 [Betaproteobacteria bacterium]|nr:hypothetical protein FACS1894185_1840 [Betaproteobacteria bacterium]GHU13801.1 hypothetical protein FACS189441_2020 [Betaproteobacteria bacterium]
MQRSAANLYDGFGRAAAYNAQSTYVSAHIGLGYALNLTEQSKLNVYGQYLWRHQNGDKLDAPKLKGDTGLLEAGLTLNPAAANKQGWSLDFGVQGYTGKREGVTGSLRARYRF